jgi:hypothetical protein
VTKAAADPHRRDSNSTVVLVRRGRDLVQVGLVRTGVRVAAVVVTSVVAAADRNGQQLRLCLCLR